MASGGFSWADRRGQPQADLPGVCRRRKEPAWHRRERARRSVARMQAKLAAGYIALQEHHASQLPRLLEHAIQEAALGSRPEVPQASCSRPGTLRMVLQRWGLPAVWVPEEVQEGVAPSGRPSPRGQSCVASAVAQAEACESATPAAGDGAEPIAEVSAITEWQSEAAETSQGTETPSGRPSPRGQSSVALGAVALAEVRESALCTAGEGGGLVQSDDAQRVASGPGPWADGFVFGRNRVEELFEAPTNRLGLRDSIVRHR